MNIVHLKASHPDYKKFELVQTLLCLATNPHMSIGIDNDIPEVEMKAIKKMIEDDMGEMINNYQFLPPNIAKVINEMEEK